MKIAVILIDYNSTERTIRYIKDLTAASDVAGLGFVIVDHGNKNHYNEYRQEFSSAVFYTATDSDIFGEKGKTDAGCKGNIVYFYSNSNPGFARGNNRGVEIADKVYNPDYYLFSNSDIELPQHFKLSRLSSILEQHAEYAVVGPRVTGPDGITQSPMKYVGITGKHIISNLLWPLNLFIPVLHRMNRNIIDNPSSGEVYAVQGSFMLVRRNAFKQVHGFDEHTFLYAEEQILAERLAKAGFREYFINEIQIQHEEGGATKDYSMSALQNLIRKRKRVHKSEMYYYHTYRHVPKPFIYLADAAFLFWTWKIGLYALMHDRMTEKKRNF